MTIEQLLEEKDALSKCVVVTRDRVNEWLEALDKVVNGNKSLNEVSSAMANLDCVVREYERALGARDEFMKKEVVEKEVKED